MKEIVSFKSARVAFVGLVATLAPLAAAQAVSPLGFEIPSPGSDGVASTVAWTDTKAEPAGPSPLGFVIPAPGKRGVAGPVHEEATAARAVSEDVFDRLGGIGGRNTN